MTDTTPMTIEGAQTLLGTLTVDKSWGEQLLAKDPTTIAQFESLTKLAASEPPAHPEGSAEAMAAASAAANDRKNFATGIDGLRKDFPVTDAVVDQISKGEPISRADWNLGNQVLKK